MNNKIDSEKTTDLRNTINQLKLNTKKTIIMKHIKRFVNRTNKPYTDADQSMDASSIEENLDEIKTIQSSKSMPTLTKKSLKDHHHQQQHQQQQQQQDLNESSISQNSNNSSSKKNVDDNMSTTSGKENTDDDAELIMSQSRTFLRKSKRLTSSQSQPVSPSPSTTPTTTKSSPKTDETKTSPLVVPVKREKKRHKRLSTTPTKKLHKSQNDKSCTELRRSTRVRTQSNTNLKPVYVCETIEGVDGRKTCVRKIERFERVTNDLMKFRENLFSKLFQRFNSTTTTGRTSTSTSTNNTPNKTKSMSCQNFDYTTSTTSARTTPLIKKLSTSASVQTNITTTATANTATEQTVIAEIGIQTDNENAIKTVDVAVGDEISDVVEMTNVVAEEDACINEEVMKTIVDMTNTVVNTHENECENGNVHENGEEEKEEEEEFDLVNDDYNKSNEIIDIYDTDLVANIPKSIIRFKSECDSKEFQEISDGIYATVTGLTEGILKLNALKSNHTNEHDTEIIYYVQRGYVTVRISNTVNLLTVGDSITIPKFNKYEIANPSKTKPAFMLFRFDKA